MIWHEQNIFIFMFPVLCYINNLALHIIYSETLILIITSLTWDVHIVINCILYVGKDVKITFIYI